jgi:predicted  nucleic acid-binding Zn-ribbon protein
MADDKIALSIEIEADRANMSLGELEDGFEQLQAKLKATNRGTEAGRKEFKKLASQMAQTSKEIKNIELSFEGLDREQVASEIGSVAGAVGDLSASLIILSGDNETLEATAQNIEKAMMVSMGLKGAIEGLSSARKLYNNLLRQANDDEKEGIALTVLKNFNTKRS